MTRTKIHYYRRGRFACLVLLLLVACASVVGKIVQLQVLDTEFLRDQGDARTKRLIRMPAYRGTITDRNGEPLAVSTPVDAVWANPKRVSLHNGQLKALAKLLQMSPQSIRKRLKSHDRNFVYLKRQINPLLASEVQRLAIDGIFLQREYRRYYPTGEVSAHVVGLTNVDDVGQEGLELAYEDWLKPHPGAKLVQKDRLGHVIHNIEIVREPQMGRSLALSLDRRVQYLAYRELKAAVNRYHALSGSLVILDIQTGEVLAMVNQPSFNPNNRAGIGPQSLRNRAVTDVFEPGSVIKAFSVAAALQSGLFQVHTPVDTRPGWLRLDGKLIRDVRNFGQLDLQGVLKKSSNVGITKIVLSLPANQYTHLLTRLGFGTVTGSGFPGERAGNISAVKDNDKFSQATLAFGYGLSLTPLQLTQAYATLGSGGIRRPVSFVRVSQQKQPGKRVMAEHTAKQVLSMLQAVLEKDGSGHRAAVPGYQVAGKTGTVRKIGEQGYIANRHRAVFAGIIPVSRPRLAAVVLIDDPRTGPYYGGMVAAPVFAKVMSGASRLLNIAPDAISHQSSDFIIPSEQDAA